MAAVQMPAELKERYRTRNAAAAQQAAFDRAEAKRDGLPVHQLDIHLEKGMHCVDCHFIQDVHGNTKLYGEVRAAIEIQCIDCHGTPASGPRLITSGPAAYTSAAESGKDGRDLSALRTPFGQRRFERRGDKIIQNSMVEPDLAWEIAQIADTIDPEIDALQRQVATWPRPSASRPTDDMRLGRRPRRRREGLRPRQREDELHRLPLVVEPELLRLPPAAEGQQEDAAASQRGRRHAQLRLLQLPDAARRRVHAGPRRRRDRQPHRPGAVVVRDPRRLVQRQPRVDLRAAANDLGRGDVRDRVQHQRAAHGPRRAAAGTIRRHRTTAGRSIASAYQPGHSDTKMCTDCHLSQDDDNNAIMAQLLMQGTNYVNFIGRYCWVAAGDHGLAAVVVTERDEPQAVIGSSLHRLAFPDDYREHVDTAAACEHAHEHSGRDVSEQSLAGREVLVDPGARRVSLCRLRRGGLRVFDIAFIDHKGFSRADRHRAGVAAGTAVLRPDQVRHGRGRADARSPPTRRAPTARRTTSSRSMPLYGYHLCDRPRGGPDPRAGRHACSTATR